MARKYPLLLLMVGVFTAASCSSSNDGFRTCEDLIDLVESDDASRSLEDWFNFVLENHSSWKPGSGGRLGVMGRRRIMIPEEFSPERFGFPSSYEVRAMLDKDGNITMLTIAINPATGIAFSYDASELDYSTIKEGRREHLGVICLRRGLLMAPTYQDPDLGPIYDHSYGM